MVDIVGLDCSIFIKIPSFFQSRTPALVFEHVNNTDFKVGPKHFLYSAKPDVETSFLGIPVVFPYSCVYVMEEYEKSSAMSSVPESQPFSGSILNHWHISTTCVSYHCPFHGSSYD